MHALCVCIFLCPGRINDYFRAMPFLIKKKNTSSTYTDQFRHESEVREIMRRFGTKEQIKLYLEMVEKKRGGDAMQRLRLDLLKEWRLMGGK